MRAMRLEDVAMTDFSNSIIVKRGFHPIGIVLAVFIMSAWSLGARSEPTSELNVQRLYRVCVDFSSNDAHAFCMTYINGVADLMQKNCEIARQRLSAGGLSNADDRRAMLSVSSDARAVYVTTAGMTHAFIDWASANPKRWNLPMVEGVMEALRANWPCK
jgi:Rap1a immunity proteins